MDKSRTSDDTRLVARCAAGDEQALALLYDRHRALAQRAARRVLHDETLAEDAVQEAFMQLWRTAAGFDAGRGAVTTWIYLLVHRRAVDIARREARRRLLSDTPGAPDPASYTAEELVVLREERRRVRAAVDELSPPQRQVVELAYWGGLTHSQLAERLGVPLGTIKSRMFDALRRLDVSLAG